MASPSASNYQRRLELYGPKLAGKLERYDQNRERRRAEREHQAQFNRHSVASANSEPLINPEDLENLTACCGIASRKIALGMTKARLNLGIFFTWIGKKICFCSPDTQLSLQAKKEDYEKQLVTVQLVDRMLSARDLAAAAERRNDTVEKLKQEAIAEAIAIELAGRNANIGERIKGVLNRWFN